jgi:hypothetical protein
VSAAVRRARAEDAGGIARVWVRSWRTAYRDVVPDALSVEVRALVQGCR